MSEPNPPPAAQAIHVTPDDIAEGEAGNCHRCPVARALGRAFGEDAEARVYERDFGMFIEVYGRSIRAPWEVRQFVYAFDGDESPEPFSFSLPPLDLSEWRESCYGCEELFEPDELDDEGYCEDCRTAGDAS